MNFENNGIRKCLGALAVCALLAAQIFAAEEKKTRLPIVSKDPYAGAIVVDVATGKAIIEDNADAQAYPASIVKLMDMLVILEKIDQGALSVSNTVSVSGEISKIGGTQVWLMEGETFTVEDLLYAMMIRSANDAALAMAMKTAGSREAFVELMNKRAQEIGMKATTFHSVHGLPPEIGKGQMPDVSTPRDLSLLGLELAKRKDIFRYTSTVKRVFRPGPKQVAMDNHNYLLGTVEGCDGFKTGYFYAGGFSIIVTAERNGRRLIAVVMGSKSRKIRDQKARELLARGFMNLPPLAPPPPVVTNTVPTNQPPAMKEVRNTTTEAFPWKKALLIGCGVFVVVWIIISMVIRRSRQTDFSN